MKLWLNTVKVSSRPERTSLIASTTACMTTSDVQRVSIVVGPLAALAVGAATSSIRDQVGATNVGVERRVVVALADHLAIALTYTGHETGRNSSPKGKIANG